MGQEEKVQDTGQAAYRIMLRREQMQDDSELLALIEGNAATRWIGEKRHIIAYPVSSKQIYNISMTQPDEDFAAAPSSQYTTRGSKSAMLKVFEDFCPLTKRMLEKVPDGEVCEWKLRVHEPLPAWVYDTVALLGDACHPTLPHLAQGAAQAIEDAAVVAVTLDRCPAPTPANLNRCLKIYEGLRKDRAEMLIKLAAASGRSLHLGEGKAREQRDQQFANGDRVPDRWADPEVQRQIYGHDCVAVAEASFDDLS
jgi:salicylate hydroxylase